VQDPKTWRDGRVWRALQECGQGPFIFCVLILLLDDMIASVRACIDGFKLNYLRLCTLLLQTGPV